MGRERQRAAVEPGRRSLRSRVVDVLCFLVHRSGLLLAGAALVRLFGGGGTRVLCYHRVAETGRADELSPGRFHAHLAHLSRRYRLLSLSALLSALDAGEHLPRNGILVTFDDGYADLVDHAVPALETAGVPAAIFVLTGAFPVGGTLWLDRIAGTPLAPKRRALAALPGREREERIASASPPRPVPPLLSAAAAAALAARDGIEVGSHGRHHSVLAALARKDRREEIEGSLRDLRTHVGIRATAFAYPWGETDDAVADLVREAGYRAAFTTGGGPIRRGADPFRLPRIHVPGDATVSRLACEAAGLLGFLRGRR